MTTHNLSMILFHHSDFGLNEAYQILAERGLTVKLEGKTLTVRWEDGPILLIRLAFGEVVQQQAADIGAGTSYASRLNECNARFEITFDNLDEVIDEINTLIEVQLTLQNATRGFLFNTWNRRLSTLPQPAGTDSRSAAQPPT